MNIPTESFYADSMAFIGLQGQPPKFETTARPQLALAHVTSVPPMIKDVTSALKAHKAFAQIALANPGVKEIRTTDDLNGMSSINTGLLFGLQHAPESLTYSNVYEFSNAGVRSMGLAYEGDTEYGGGFKSGGRLKGRGEKLIEWMAKTDIILDLSHAGHSTARGALRFIAQERLPVKPMLSHSACESVFNHQRNVPDDILRGVDRAGGYVGIPLISFYLGAQGSDPLTEFACHITHALSVVGKGKVGIGSDCNHLNMTMEQAQAHFDKMVAMLKTGGTFGEYFPDRPPELIKHGGNMFKVIEHTLSTGNTLMFDSGILGRNFKDFLSRSLPQV